MSEPKSTGPLNLPANKISQGNIPLGSMHTLLRPRLSQRPHARHINDERKEKIIGNFPLDGSSHQPGDAAFTPATSQDLQHSRANTDSSNSHNTQQTRVKTKCHSLYAKGQLAQPGVFLRVNHTKPKWPQMLMLRADVYARALRASQNVKKAEVWVGARCALWVGGAWASAGVEGTRMGWHDL
jgi:hypothetical protein